MAATAKYDTRIDLQVSTETKEAYRKAAEREGRDLSSWIRWTLDARARRRKAAR